MEILCRVVDVDMTLWRRDDVMDIRHHVAGPAMNVTVTEAISEIGRKGI